MKWFLIKKVVLEEDVDIKKVNGRNCREYEYIYIYKYKIDE